LRRAMLPVISLERFGNLDAARRMEEPNAVRAMLDGGAVQTCRLIVGLCTPIPKGNLRRDKECVSRVNEVMTKRSETRAG
jgi:hypothetical protein